MMRYMPKPLKVAVADLLTILGGGTEFHDVSGSLYTVESYTVTQGRFSDYTLVVICDDRGQLWGWNWHQNHAGDSGEDYADDADGMADFVPVKKATTTTVEYIVMD